MFFPRTLRFAVVALWATLSLAVAAPALHPSCIAALTPEATPVELAVPGGPVLRHATAKDIPALIAMLQREFGYGANDEAFDAIPEKYTELAGELHLPYRERTQEYWVIASADGTLLGGIGLAYYYSHDRTRHWWLEWFTLAPSLRGHRLGAALVEFIENRARSRGAVGLNLYTSTAPQEATANLLYSKRGYAIYRSLPDTLVDGTAIEDLFRYKPF
jgi:GNAT superfamily N-acetyltransferase